MIKLSATSKLGCKSWSLQAGDTCPGSYDKTGGLVPACAGCYAKGGNYRFANVKAPREHNKLDWQRPEFTAEFIAALDTERYFRWFDSGDMYALGLAEKLFDIMQATPWVKHWLPTRMHKFPKFAGILAKMQALPNVSVRFSSDSVTGDYEAGLHGSVIVPDTDSVPGEAFLCGAYSREGKCGSCKACWNKDVSVIAYPAHGRSMAKVIRIALAA